MTKSANKTFESIRAEERIAIEKARVERAKVKGGSPGTGNDYLGLSFSGGGIRSATFNLGVLQALARLRLLGRFDYLSTVSGGGYIGSWLTAWIHRTSFGKVHSELVARDVRRNGVPEAPQIRWLRRYSNYLTPKKGLFSGDTWAMIGIYLRNTSLNLTILTFTLAVLLLAPYLVVAFTRSWFDHLAPRTLTASLLLLGLGLALTIANLSDLSRRLQDKNKPPFGARPWVVNIFVIGGGLAASFLLAAWFWPQREDLFMSPAASDLSFAIKVGGITAAMWGGAWAFGALIRFIGRLVRIALGLLPQLPPSERARRGWPPLWWRRAQLIWRHFREFGRSANGSNERWKGYFEEIWDCYWKPEDSPPEPEPAWRRIGRTAGLTASAFVAGFVGGYLLAAMFRGLTGLANSNAFAPDWHIGMWSGCAVAFALLVIATVHIGLAGNLFTEDVREWWGRLGGLFILWMLLGAALFAISIDFPLAFQWLGSEGYLRDWGKALAGVVWAAITGGGLYVGKSEDSGKSKGGIQDFIGRIAPATFVIGLLLVLSLGVSKATPVLAENAHGIACTWQVLEWSAPCCHQQNPPSPRGQMVSAYWSGIERLGYCSLLFLLLVIAAVAIVLSYRVGINHFSMHAFYKNRLVRCYLGASRFHDYGTDREAQPFTGFDPNDDLPLSDLRVEECEPCAPGRIDKLWQGAKNVAADVAQSTVRLVSKPVFWLANFFGMHPPPAMAPERAAPQPEPPKPRPFDGPFPIINTALNLVGGKNLAWQQRKAAGFAITPIHSGYQIESENGCDPVVAFEKTRDCAGGVPRNPLTLGMALATSGAAASPNMGYHTSPTLSFLMTIFNVRLGWWLPNPNTAACENFWNSRGPRTGLMYLLAEMMGRTSEEGRYVYLSDGGHFENLGIYELVRRKCRFIVACDAGADPTLCFEDLGNAIEKCRADFGVDIEICVEPIRRLENGKSKWHCAVGKIRYDHTDSAAQVGTLLYIKASLTGEEPTDVLRYADANPEFPHQPTSDQFFDESQFESYRMLGEHITTEVFEAAADPEFLHDMPLPELFLNLRQHWLPPAGAADGAFTRHTANYRALLKEIREDRNLRFLDAQIWPEWPNLIPQNARRAAFWLRSEPDRLWLPESEEEIRAGFYACNRLIQLMEDVYTDLNLNEEWEHPDNRGWVNLFQHWSWSGMFCATYAISANLYGARFQRFCERRLDLRVGELVIPAAATWPVIPEPVPEQSLEVRLAAVRQAVAQHLLNFWEQQLIETYLRFYDAACDLYVAPLRIRRRSPDESKELEFTIGFALLTGPYNGLAELRYLRVQNHLRRTGFGRQGLAQIQAEVQRAGAQLEVPALALTDEQIDGIQQELPKQLRLDPDSSRWEAVPRQDDLDYLRRMLQGVR